MDPITVLLSALAIAPSLASPTANQTVNDAYAGLKALIQRKFANEDPSLPELLEDHESDPEVYSKPLRKHLLQVGAEHDQEIIDRAVELLNEAEAAAGTPQAIDIAGGDFVGRNVFVASGVGRVNTVNAQSGRVVIAQGNIGSVSVYTDFYQANEILDRLRGRVARLIPAEQAITALLERQDPRPDTLTALRQRLTPRTQLTNSSIDSDLKVVNEISASLKPREQDEVSDEVKQRVLTITDSVNIRISTLHSIFVRLVHSAVASSEVAEASISKIAHMDLRDESLVHARVISRLSQSLNPSELTSSNFDVLSDAAYGTIGILSDIQMRLDMIEVILERDAGRRRFTASVVTAYIVAALVITIFSVSIVSLQLPAADAPLSSLRLPVFGVPWPVVVWSLVGSFAAMIHRFNANPIQDFGDAVKWMITRPVQGVVLGSAMYLVLLSGLVILGGGTQPAGSSETGRADAVLLVLAFLVGFSDRFADSIFNSLVQRYSGDGAAVRASTHAGDIEPSVRKSSENGLFQIGAGHRPRSPSMPLRRRSAGRFTHLKDASNATHTDGSTNEDQPPNGQASSQSVT